MIDLHAHVLPGLDDGAPDLEAAIALAEAAAADGTTVIAATPHIRADYPDVDPATIAARAAELDAQVTPGIVPAGEVDALWAAQAGADRLRPVTYGGNGRDILLETPYGELPPSFDDIFFRLVAQGLRPLIAHPERNATFKRDPERLRTLVDRGALLQVTAMALTAPRRSRSGRLATALVRDGLAHVIASDAHAATGHRTPILSAAVAAADRIAPGRGAWMTQDAPAAVLAGDPLPPAPSVRPRGLARLLGR